MSITTMLPMLEQRELLMYLTENYFVIKIKLIIKYIKIRKLLLSVGLASLLLAGLAGCLKDEEFEDQQYGLQVPDVPSVSFPQKLQSPFTIGIVQQASAQEVTGPLLALN